MESYKIFNDPVHGTIKLRTALVKIIDTPEFQRLRYIKQLGATSYVFPGAQHTRFEHSIGTAHLAGKLVRHLIKQRSEDAKKSENKKTELMEQQGEEKEEPETNNNILCVEIAALCHDLGHGPFSDVFQDKFMEEYKKDDETSWKHEKMSCEIFDEIMMKLREDEGIKRILPPESDDEFIKDLIMGRGNTDEKRRESKGFFYDILFNGGNALNVSMWDYMARDSFHVGISNAFDHKRFMQFLAVKICSENGKDTEHICVSEKEIFNLYGMYDTVLSLHRRVYQHPGVNAVKHMICDILLEADKCETFLVPGDEGSEKVRISECVDNVKNFCRLDDRILLKIQDSEEEELNNARSLINSLQVGKRYRLARKQVLDEYYSEMKSHAIISDIVKGKQDLHEDMVRVSVLKFEFGEGEEPMHTVWTYNKRKYQEIDAIEEDVSSLMPQVFRETVIQVFCVDERYKASLQDAFNEWYLEPLPQSVTLLRNFCNQSRYLNKAAGKMEEKLERFEERIGELEKNITRKLDELKEGLAAKEARARKNEETSQDVAVKRSKLDRYKLSESPRRTNK